MIPIVTALLGTAVGLALSGPARDAVAWARGHLVALPPIVPAPSTPSTPVNGNPGPMPPGILAPPPAPTPVQDPPTATLADTPGPLRSILTTYGPGGGPPIRPPGETPAQGGQRYSLLSPPTISPLLMPPSGSHCGCTGSGPCQCATH